MNDTTIYITLLPVANGRLFEPETQRIDGTEQIRQIELVTTNSDTMLITSYTKNSSPYCMTIYINIIFTRTIQARLIKSFALAGLEYNHRLRAIAKRKKREIPAGPF